MTGRRGAGRESPRREAGRAAPALRVAFSSDAAEHEEAIAIREWLSAVPGVSAETVSLGRAARAEADVLWLHGVQAVELDSLGPAGAERLTDGRVLLTGGAAVLAAAAGLDPVPPNQMTRLESRVPEPAGGGDGAARGLVLGHASFRGHPLFDGLGTGASTWSPAEDESYTLVSYVRPAWPARGRVLAVARRGRHPDPCRATIWEHDGARGRTVCIGAYLPFHAADPRFRPQLERLALNALQRAAAAPAPAEEGRSWPLPELAVREDRGLPLPELPLLEEPLDGLEFRLRAAGGAGGDAPFTLAGRRAFATGGEARGIDEVWAHPVRLLVGLRVRGAEAETVALTPIGIERRLRLGGILLLERAVIPREGPVCVVEWRTRGGGGDVQVEWTSDLRVAAPYPADINGPLRWRKAARGLVLAGSGGDDAVYAFSRAPDRLDVEDASDAERPRVRVRALFRLRARGSVRLAVAGGGGEPQLRRALAAAERVEATMEARRGNAERLLSDRLALDGPDPLVCQAVEWAKIRLAGSVVEAPAVGRSLVAGYGPEGAAAGGAGSGGCTSCRTADSVWGALACLATGEFAAARDVLAFLGRHQDLAGAIPRECTTSGWVDHAGADATPLYLLLAARYHAWTGDLRFVRAEWPRILRAYAWCRSTGQHNDGLPGAPDPQTHADGWSAGGDGSAADVTLAVAAIWTAVLGELAEAADAIGETGAAVELRGAGTRARTAMESAFFVPQTGAWAARLRREGDGWRRVMAQGPAQALPLMLGLTDGRGMEPWLDAIAGPAYTTPWGVRSLSATDPGYDPASRSSGAVRPLFTGWVSWAEYAAGRPDAGYRHWRANIDAAMRGHRGRLPDLLRGDRPEGAGECPDSTSSTAMLVLPLIHGLLGAEPDASRGRLVLRPRPPSEWTRFTLSRLAVGDASVTVSYRRDGGAHRIRVSQERGSVPLQLVLEPALPGRRLRSARVDGVTADLEPRPGRDRVEVPVQVVLDHPREVLLEVE